MEELFFENAEEFEKIQKPEGITELEPGVKYEKIGEIQKTADFSDESKELIVGDYKEAMEHWHMQLESESCVITQEISVAEQLLGKDFSEEKMLEFSKQMGWYDGGRISEGDCGKLLEHMGLEVEKSENLGLNDLVQELTEGNRVICGVNNGMLYEPELSEVPGIRANHVVQVIGIDMTNPNDVKVILNDSGVENGRGVAVSADTFMKAWKTSDNFTLTARKGA